MKKYTVYLTVLIAVLSACKNEQPTQHDDDRGCVISKELKPLIKLDTLKTIPINQELELTGSVAYDQDHLYSYQSLISGVIEAVNFKLGDYVHKGQPLLTVRTAEVSGQKAELLKARTEIILLKRKVSATQNLYNDGVAAERELLEAKNELAAAQAEVIRLEETLKLQGANVEKSLVIVKAPANGYIVDKKVTQGTQIDTGQDDLFVISDLKKVWVMANVYVTQLEKVKVGQLVEIESTAYPEKVFKGKVTRLSNTFDSEERVLKAIIEIDNSKLELKPSMMVNVNVYQPTKQLAVAIPKHAVIFDNNSYHLLKYETDCAVLRIAITPIAKDKKYFYVEPGSIGEGTTVIGQNQLLIYNQIKER
ncbi:efflux RND transporter periplasmic adaptor subunit [Pedobacter sp. ASV28]|uniref:efflux RND transporter periplasmic adaptor subunit n=1 Tax=Pedobacter sp. ASV28 TaxID=2795123 RepID=UPI0018EC8BB6|nr:efflux RND transporter periplasmic adaptor subunit [Pedobacter sp. ASV28]